MKILIDKGANINQMDNTGMTPVHIAAFNQKASVTRLGGKFRFYSFMYNVQRLLQKKQTNAFPLSVFSTYDYAYSPFFATVSMCYAT